MNKLDNATNAQAVDSLLNYETVGKINYGQPPLKWHVKVLMN